VFDLVNVLIITYYFPPEGGPAVQRISKFVKYLPLYSYNPIVLTSIHPIKIIDKSLYKEVKDKCKIIKTIDWASYLPGEVLKYFKRFMFPDKHYSWVGSAIKKGKQLINDHNIKLVFSTSPPHSVHIVAQKLSMLYDIPFVADFRDEWSDNPDFETWINHKKQKELELSIISNASFVTTISKGAATRLNNKNHKNNIECIYNGYDNDDFVNIVTPVSNNKVLTFAYGGRLSEHHDPTEFFEALRLVANSNKISSSEIKATFWGNNNEAKWMSKYPDLQDIVIFEPHLSHLDYLQTIASYDVLLLFVTNMQNSDMLTGKVYEYMRLKKTILVIMDRDCELTDILSEYGNSIICYTKDLTNIVNAISKLISLKKTNELDCDIKQDYLLRYDRKSQTHSLSMIFDKCLGN
jgi:glycosyltransferase involved in cell wall biosynthesis